METLIENWPVLAAGLAVLVAAGLGIYRFVGLPTQEQLDKVRKWLLWAVTEAEKELGSGTGELKLRQVYDLFVVRFPWLAKVISFDLFSALVDEALEEMRELLDTNQAVSAFVNGADSQ